MRLTPLRVRMERSRRLRSEADFQRVRQQGRCWTHRLLVLCALRSPGGGTRLGVAAGKKIGKAVVRNRVKRLIREAFRARANSVSPGADIVIVARPPAREAGFWEIDAAIHGLLRKASLLREEKGSEAADGEAHSPVPH